MKRYFSASILSFGLIFTVSPASAETLWCATNQTTEIDKSKCHSSKKKCEEYIKEKVRKAPAKYGQWACFPWYKS